MRLTLVISSLSRGGAERAMSILASSWAEQGKAVSLLTLDEAPPAYALHPSVRLERLGVASVSSNLLQGLVRNFQRLRILRQRIRKSNPDIIVSFMEKISVLTILATRGLGKPLIISERTDPAGYEVGPIWGTLRRWTYRFAYALVCQTESGLDWFRQIGPVKSFVIPNPVTAPKLAASKGFDGHPAGWRLISMGRLTKEKGFDFLLQSFSLVAVKYPQWSLLIIGTGPLRKSLELQAMALGLDGRVKFLGELTDPFAKLREADLFILSSRVEGFPNALCEAMACGLPAISFDCPSGPRDIIRHGIDGILVPANDVQALADAMDSLMGDPELRRRLALKAPDVVTRFSSERILGLWERLFLECS